VNLLVAKLIASLARTVRKLISKSEVADELSRVKNKGIGIRLEGPGTVLEPENLVLEDYVSIGENHFFRCKGGVRIGKYTRLSRNVVIHTVNHNYNGTMLPYDRTDVTSPITIGSYVWIGMNACILPGSTIGDGAIIGMGAVVSGKVNPGEIVVGAKIRVIGKRNEDHTLDLTKKDAFLKSGGDADA